MRRMCFCFKMFAALTTARTLMLFPLLPGMPLIGAPLPSQHVSLQPFRLPVLYASGCRFGPETVPAKGEFHVARIGLKDLDSSQTVILLIKCDSK